MSKAGVRGAHKTSVTHWWHQRLTAVALILLGLWFALSLIIIDPGSLAELLAWMGNPATAILLGLLALAGTYHSWLGVQVVLEDYVPHAGQLRFSLALSLIAHVVVLAACLFAILRIALGSA
jgi:succinate dehydrogenase / fumarate reductase membrane anchor subunit